MAEEHALVRGLRARDEEAFAELVSRFNHVLLPLAAFYVSSTADAEEVVQEAWLAVLRGIDRFEERSSFRTWISRIVMNIARTRGVRERRMVTFSDLADAESGEPFEAVESSRFQAAGGEYPDHWSVAPRSWNRDPEQSILSREMLAAVESAMESLPKAQRLVVRLRDVCGWTAGDVCDALGISEANQRVLLHRGRSRVRALLEADRRRLHVSARPARHAARVAHAAAG